jgi:protein-S-isoprenylcysteine O-methyltransferase Ste14
MIKIGNFFFRYRNNLFILLYLALFIPSPPLFPVSIIGDKYYFYPIILGLVVTFSGEAIRAVTIGLAYIIRGGKNKKVYAEDLVTEGIFRHCRNPLYIGNILMLLGVGILVNSLLYVLVVIPLFIFIYQAIVLAEEDFLSRKFGPQFRAYCQQVNRWIPNPTGIGQTLRGMKFNTNRWIFKEYNTLTVWLTGITLILLFKYPQITGYDEQRKYVILTIVLILLAITYGVTRYLKKSGGRAKFSGSG